MRGWLRAVTALRLLQHDGVERLLIKHLRTDEDKAVRVAAIRALDDRAPTEKAGTALVQAAQNDKKARVRYEAVHLMKKWAGDLPFLRDGLKKVAAADPEMSIRDAARDDI